MAKQKPKNGQHFVALLVGGDTRLQAAMCRALAERGVLVSESWSAAKNLDKRALPDGIELAFIVRDTAISRQVRDRLAFAAKQRGARVIDVKNMSDAWGQLDRHGYTAPAVEFEVATPETQEPDIAQEAGVRGETDREKFIRLGKLIRHKREDLGLTLNAVGRAIGCSGSNLGFIEKGSATPSDQMLSAIERYYGVPAGSFPRVAKRRNLRIGIPPAPEPEVVRGPVIDMPLPAVEIEPAPSGAPSVAVPRPIDDGIDGQDADPDHVRLHLEVLAIQSRMKRLGIARIELTPVLLSVHRHEQGAQS